MPFETVSQVVEEQARLALHSTENVDSFLRLPTAEQVARLNTWSVLKLLGLALYSVQRCTMAETTFARMWYETLRQLDDVAEIRQAMRDTDTILSGSRCVRFLYCDVHFVCGDWDWYTTSSGVEASCAFVTNKLRGKEVARFAGHYTDDDNTPKCYTHCAPELIKHESSALRTAISMLCAAKQYGFCLAYPTAFFQRLNMQTHRDLQPHDLRAIAKAFVTNTRNPSGTYSAWHMFLSTKAGLPNVAARLFRVLKRFWGSRTPIAICWTFKCPDNVMMQGGASTKRLKAYAALSVSQICLFSYPLSPVDRDHTSNAIVSASANC
ncbi:uncharacterized protein PHACADRAFT_33525 [Phanerochaete carnosa HHB-10118-sp]|uniref:Uncharacterized protein n=1 Tax=Phanerochaete carnosa (strain HHB-10118-sp) TaxID=650164 RepID=K5VE12_PHACS|nr:uncharacterized protein PHACADRAFT_33525 [Phanerochaete carnosa HHB-10118-sp]EKM49348.1 hypothetical protein PHACADRAFT_33525 [Phanerochaete carnosa HHB-10118-sp]